MSAVLTDWYPGDRALELISIVALGVMLLSAAGWGASRPFSRSPAIRHLILASALFGCLGMPLLAAAVSRSGFTLVAIPILPEESAGKDGIRFSSGLTSPAPLGIREAEHPASRADGPIDPSPPVDGAPGLERPASSPRLAKASPPPSSSMPGPGRRPAAVAPGWTSLDRGLATFTLLAWGSVSVLLLLRLMRGSLKVRRILRSSRVLLDPRLRILLDDICRDLGLGRPPRVLVSHRVATPLAVGVRAPTVLLPERLLGAVGEDELRDVLLHEAAHLSRRDPLIVLFQELARALYWPIPPLHALIRELGRAREELCDNHVLQRRDPLSYGETLLHLAELSMAGRPLAVAVGVLNWTGELERRIAGFLDQGRSTMTRSHRGIVCLVAVLFVAAGALASATRLSARSDRPAPGSGAKPVPKAVVKAPDEKPGRSMLIHVLGPDGRPMPGVEIHRSVWTRPPGKGNQRHLSDDRGEVRVDIPRGIYIVRLWARARGYVPLFAHWEEEDNPETSLPAEYTFRLSRGTVIGGVVRDSEGRPIKGVSLQVKLERGGRIEGRTSHDSWLAEKDPTTHQVTMPITDEQGRWTLDNVPQGDSLDIKLKLEHPDYISDPNWGTSQEEQGVDLKALRARTATITMRGGLVATGTVSDPAGKPVVGAVVVRGDRPYWEPDSQEVRTDQRGRYRLPPLPSGKVTVTVIARGWMPAQRKVEVRPGMKDEDFRLEPGKELRVRIVDQAGKPVPGVGVRINRWREGEALYNDRHPNVLDTGIPTQADETGLYRWTWAPGDVVSYGLGKDGYARHEVELTAGGDGQTVRLPRILRISGKVTDPSGRPVKGVTAIPVLEFRPGHLLVERFQAKGPFDGTYAVEGERTDVSYRVRIEALGHRSAMSDVAKPGQIDTKIDFRLEAAPSVAGRVLDPEGRAVRDARVYLATKSQMVNDWVDDSLGNLKAVSDSEGRFALPAQFERYALIAVHDRGYTELQLEPDQRAGDLVLRPWAQVEGRLVQAGQPVPSAWITFEPIRVLNGVLPHIQDNFAVKTDRDGRFAFPRVPPVKASVRAQLSVWRDSPLTSSQSVPLDLQPGEHAVVNLGGEGTMIKGRVVLSGDAATKNDLHKSLNWLLRRAPGIEPPAEVRSPGLSPRGGWNNAWLSTPEGMGLIGTLHNYFVVLDEAGRFRVSGVPAGDYDLALRLYEPPGGGCLVSPVGSKILRFRVTEAQARGAGLDLGEISVAVARGPQVGQMAPDFTAAGPSGEAVTLSGLRGRHVLLDFWATWCGPCVANLPALGRLHETLGADPRIAIVGLNLDDDPAGARAFVEARKLPWTQAYLGGRAEARDEILARYAIGSIPTYILIGPDGKIVQQGNDFEPIAGALRRLAR